MIDAQGGPSRRGEFVHAGRSVPAFLRAAEEEYRAARDGVAVLRLPWRSLILVEGKDAAGFLHGLLTQDIKGMADGAVRPACSVDRRGHLLADLWIRKEGDAYRLEVQSDRSDPVLAILESHRIMEDVRIRPILEEEVWLATGAGAAAFLDDLGLSGWEVTDTGGRDFHVATKQPEAFRRQATDAGAIEIGGLTLDRLRIEAGRPWFGRDMNESHFPMEVRLEDAISFSKGCYLGQETIARIHYRGKTNRRLAGLRFHGEPGRAGESVLREGREMGIVTSAAAVLRYPGDGLALAILAADLAEAGVEVGVGGKRAVVEDLPFQESVR